jgi:hypothetical protein
MMETAAAEVEKQFFRIEPNCRLLDGGTTRLFFRIEPNSRDSFGYPMGYSHKMKDAFLAFAVWWCVSRQ